MSRWSLVPMPEIAENAIGENLAGERWAEQIGWLLGSKIKGKHTKKIANPGNSKLFIKYIASSNFLLITTCIDPI